MKTTTNQAQKVGRLQLPFWSALVVVGLILGAVPMMGRVQAASNPGLTRQPSAGNSLAGLLNADGTLNNHDRPAARARACA